MSADIFISFASQDVRTANTICSALESRGFKCWIATRDIRPGENFQSAIVHAIRDAKVLLLVFTANSNRSDEMTKELALASQQKLMVVPLRVENVTPSDAFAYEFATRQWIDLFADWEQAMNHLSARLSAALSDDRTHTDTIVLGKPSLQGAGALQALVARRKRLAIGVAAGTVVLAAVVLIAVLGGDGSPEQQVAPQQDASAAAAVPAPTLPEAAQTAASPDPVQPSSATAADTAGVAAAAPAQGQAGGSAPGEAAKPASKPPPRKPSSLPY